MDYKECEKKKTKWRFETLLFILSDRNTSTLQIAVSCNMYLDCNLIYRSLYLEQDPCMKVTVSGPIPLPRPLHLDRIPVSRPSCLLQILLSRSDTSGSSCLVVCSSLYRNLILLSRSYFCNQILVSTLTEYPDTCIQILVSRLYPCI